MANAGGGTLPGNTDVTQIKTGRPVVRGTQGVVCSGNQLTSMSAMRMLLSGGNAFDAAAAAGFAAAVIEPLAHYSLATEGALMLYQSASNRLIALSGQGVAAGRATVELFKQRGFDKIPTGPGPNAELSFTVPGVVDAFLLMLETYGTKTVAEVMAPAIDYARRGFPMYEFLHDRFARRPQYREQFANYPPGGMDVFYPGGSPPEVGQLLVQKQLAVTMSKMVQAEAEVSGNRVAGIRAARDMFYRGEIAKTIVQCSDRVGGLLSLEDLANYHATFEEPIRSTIMGYDIYTQSVWTQGAVLLQALNILEHFDLRAMGHNSPQYIHTITEALKLAFADRELYYGDPEFARVPIDGLLSKEYAAARARLIKADQACPELPEPGDPWRYSAEAGATAGTMAMPAATPESGSDDSGDGTTYLSVIDRDGNMVAATISGGNPSKSVYFPELGCCLSTRSEMFFVDDQHPNGVQPAKRPRTTLVNYIVCKDGRPFLTIGCPGRDDQSQADLQLFLNVLMFGMDPQQAVESPRFASRSLIDSFYPRVYLPGQLNVEPGIPDQARSKLADLGHKIVEADVCGMGAILAQRDPKTGALSAGADPNRPTYALGW